MKMDEKEEVMILDCVRFEEVLPDLDRPGTPGAGLRESALAHAESCGRCARLLTESESLDFSLHSLAVRDAFREAPSRVEAALLKRFRLEKGLAARRRLQCQLSLLGAAAAMLLVVGLSFHQRRLALPSLHSSAPSAVPSPQQPVGAPDATYVADDDGAGAFIPLPYADDLDAEGGTIVRVILSRSALASLGMPDAALEASDQVPADLIVSQDGTPQAIRFVAQDELNQD